MMFLCSLATRVAHFRASLFRLCSSAVPLSFSISVTYHRKEMLQSQAYLLWQAEYIACILCACVNRNDAPSISLDHRMMLVHYFHILLTITICNTGYVCSSQEREQMKSLGA